jgi:hypothetical protein
MLIGVKTWEHLLANRDLGGVILFGTVLASMTASASSTAASRRNDIVGVILGAVIYLALSIGFHPLLVGLPVFGTPAN